MRQKAAPFSLVFQALQHFFSSQVYHPQDHPSSSLRLSSSLQNTSSGTGNNSLWLRTQDQSYVESRLFERLGLWCGRPELDYTSSLGRRFPLKGLKKFHRPSRRVGRHQPAKMSSHLGMTFLGARMENSCLISLPIYWTTLISNALKCEGHPNGELL